MDAFTISWETQLNYAFPPFSLIPRVLSKVQQDQAYVLLVAPVWTCQIWYPMLLRLLIERPVLLPRWRNLTTQRQASPSTTSDSPSRVACVRREL